MAGNSILLHRGPVSITISASRVPADYYRTRSGRYIYEDFCSGIVPKAKPVRAGAVFKVTIAELAKEDLLDHEIEAALPNQHVFDESALCAIVARVLLDRIRFPRQQRLIDEEIAAGQQHAVRRHEIVGGEPDDIVAYTATRDFNRAIADFGEAIQLDPKYSLALNNRGNTRQPHSQDRADTARAR
jgi:hypothetical protein